MAVRGAALRAGSARVRSCGDLKVQACAASGGHERPRANGVARSAAVAPASSSEKTHLSNGHQVATTQDAVDLYSWQKPTTAQRSPSRAEMGPAAEVLSWCPRSDAELPWLPAARRLGGLEKLPTWVTELTHGSEVNVRSIGGANDRTWLTQRNQVAGVSLISCNISGADYMSGPDFQIAVQEVYVELMSKLERSGKKPFRFWNFIPDINAASFANDGLPDGQTRYMRFNGGRCKALSEHWGSEGAMNKLVCTATGIGHVGADFTMHCLASDAAALPVENPRQVPAYNYSRKWGPKAPSFARATVWTHGSTGRRLLVAGGTASVVGEETAHTGCLSMQFNETMLNLTTLLQQGIGKIGGDGETDGATWGPIPPYFSYSVYYRHASDLPWLRAQFERFAAPGTKVEYLPAVVCRRELLVEIEACAELDCHESASSFVCHPMVTDSLVYPPHFDF